MDSASSHSPNQNKVGSDVAEYESDQRLLLQAGFDQRTVLLLRSLLQRIRSQLQRRNGFLTALFVSWMAKRSWFIDDFSRCDLCLGEFSRRYLGGGLIGKLT